MNVVLVSKLHFKGNFAVSVGLRLNSVGLFVCACVQAELSMVSESVSAQALVTVTVLDVNDERPTFSQSLYPASISDSAQPGDLVSMPSLITVTDHDQVDLLPPSRLSINQSINQWDL